MGVYIYPARHTVQVGQPAMFSCAVSGHPIHFVRWMKNGKEQKSEQLQGSYNKPSILTIPSAQKGDSGMYQCFTGNDMEIVQATAELRLGGQFHDFFKTINTSFLFHFVIF